MKVKLVLLRGEQRVREIPVNLPVAIIGRGAGADIRIMSHEISRHHCRLKIRDDVISVKDLGSANGTSVNGQQILDKEELHHGDLLQLGQVSLLVEVEALKALPVDESEVPDGAVVTEGVVVLEEEPPPIPVEVTPVEEGAPVTVEAVEGVEMPADLLRELQQDLPTIADTDEELPMADVEDDTEDLPMAEAEEDENPAGSHATPA
jgi:pSer/pThr/pTyr-binding forkhead associated (FHA) protein